MNILKMSNIFLIILLLIQKAIFLQIAYSYLYRSTWPFHSSSGYTFRLIFFPW